MTLLSYIKNNLSADQQTVYQMAQYYGQKYEYAALSTLMKTYEAKHTLDVCTSLDLYLENSEFSHLVWDYACMKTLVEGLELLYCPTDDLFTASLLSTDGFQEDLESKLAYLKLDSDLRCRRCYPDKYLAEKIAKLPKRIQDKWGLETMFDSLVYVKEVELA